MLVFDYLIWHYTAAPKGLLIITRDYLHAVGHKFFIGRHLRTLFSPWMRQDIPPASEERSVGQVISDAIFNRIASVFFRLVAASIRLTIIAAGLAAAAVTLAFFTAVMLVWLAWPVLALAALWYGARLLLTFPYGI